MEFKKIQLLGFKSFAEKTNSEICAIVKKQLKITKSKILEKSKEKSE